MDFPDLKTRYRQFVAEALAVRAEHAYQCRLRDASEIYGVEIAGRPAAVPFEELLERYEKLMHEWAGEEPDSVGCISSCLELVGEIVCDELRWRIDPYAGSVSGERDLGYALEMLGAARRWLNGKEMVELVETTRRRSRAQSGRDLIVNLFEALPEAERREVAAQLRDSTSGEASR